MCAHRVVHECGFLSAAHAARAKDVALVLVNAPEGFAAGVFERAWRNAGTRICADGGANRLFDRFDTAQARREYAPDVIVGDLDSLRSEVRVFYESCGTEVVLVEDQNMHDMGKAVGVAVQRFEAGAGPGAAASGLSIAVLGALGGRLDHEMANLDMLFKWQGRVSSLVLLSRTSLALLLPAGLNEIRRNLEFEARTCGLLPLGGPCAGVSTKGLRWDLDNSTLAFGSLVSTSNEALEGTVQVQTDSPLLWTSVLQNHVGEP